MNLYSGHAPTAMELAGTMGCSRQSVKEILTSLEKKGFVRMQTDGKDRRKQRIYLTEKAGELSKRYREREAAFLELLYEGVEEADIAHVYEVLSRLEDNLRGMRAGELRKGESE